MAWATLTIVVKKGFLKKIPFRLTLKKQESAIQTAKTGTFITENTVCVKLQYGKVFFRVLEVERSPEIHSKHSIQTTITKISLLGGSFKALSHNSRSSAS